MHSWEAIQSAIEYIESHLTDDLQIEQIAQSACLSAYYFQRLFSSLVGCPVADYIRLRKLAAASTEIQYSHEPIFSIAFKYKFSDSANFTRAFREAYGLSPAEYRANPQSLKHFSKPDLKLQHFNLSENDIVVSDGMAVRMERVQLLQARVFEGLVANIPESQFVGSRNTGVAYAGILWDEFHRAKTAVTSWLEGGAEIGVLLRAGTVGGTCLYLAGAEIQQCSRQPDCESYVMQPGEYLVCSFEAPTFLELTGSALEKAYSILLKMANGRRTTCIEIYPGNSSEGCSMQLWLQMSEKGQYASPPADTVAPAALSEMSARVNHPLWEGLCTHLITVYQAKPVMEYSKCSLQPGWNVKFKKSGRTLCTLYPATGAFKALLVIGTAERLPFEMELPLMTEYMQCLYQQTKTGMDQKWLMVDVSSAEVLGNLKVGIEIRYQTNHRRVKGKNA